MNDTLNIRQMEEKDIDQVLVIEHASFATPWTKEAFYNEIHNNRFALYFVLEDEGKVIGYCGAWVVVDEAHITNVAILPDYRGRGLGEKMMKKLAFAAKDLGVETMTLEVRMSNVVAQSLYRKLGFQDGGIRKNYYTDNQEDGLVMWVKI